MSDPTTTKTKIKTSTKVAFLIGAAAIAAAGLVISTTGVLKVAPPTVTFTASSLLVPPGAFVTLSWTSSNATSCAASGGWMGYKDISGSQATSAMTSAQTYTLSCTGKGGTTSKSLTVSLTSLAPAISPPVLRTTSTKTKSMY